jgi:Cft2 family RNA processing exonuclease
MTAFDYTDHIHLPGADLALDPPRRSAFAFVSHGHSDHIGRHESGIGTPATVALVERRLGTCRLSRLDFGARLERRGHQITLAPAGHVLGAAQIVVDDPHGQRFVYTGDFSVRPRATIVAAQPIRADVLIMECTFGLPRYVFPSDDEIRVRIRDFIDYTLNAGLTPVVLGYSLGKSQEAISLVNGLGYSVCVDPAVARIADVYGAFGVELGPYVVYNGAVPPGHVLIAPPNGRRADKLRRERRLYLSGWAMDQSTKYRLGVDDAIPLSDHPGFDELVAFVEAVQPRLVYTTHGPSAFADHLCRLGYQAEHLGVHQLALL